jgi:conjugal transfer pilus assembly protein TraI
MERGLAIPRLDALGQHPTWRMAPALLSTENGKPVELSMLRLKDPGVLFPFGAPGVVELWSRPEAETSVRSEPLRPSEPVAASQGAVAGQLASRPATVGVSPPAASFAEQPPETVRASPPAPSSALIPQARRWLNEASASTARLAKAIDSLDRENNAHALWRDGLLWLRYPDWFEAAGWKAPDAAQALSEDGWLEPDAQTPMRRVRDHAGQRWLALQAEASDRLRALLGEARQTNINPLASAESPMVSSTPTHTQAEDVSAREPAEDPHLIETVIRTLTLKYGHGDGAQERVLDPDTLKTLSKDTQLGIYHLRDRLLSDPRFRQDQQHRLIVTL